MAAPEVADLANTELFAGLDEHSLRIVAEWFEVEDAVVGQRLTMEGNAGYAFFVLHEGSADVSVHGETVRALQVGDFFGELSMLGDGRQTATVTVTTPSVVWTMFGTRFRELQRHHPEIAATISATALQRLSS
jgi:CRP-like cAMP-binding protein